MSLYGELKRRNVIRVAIAYLAGAWLLAELAGMVFSYFGWPESNIRYLLIVLALGFLPALIFAWSYVITPGGMIRDASVARSSARRIDVITSGLVVAALVFVAILRFWSADDVTHEPAGQGVASSGIAEQQHEPSSVAYPANSIAVLPFVNMSDDEANEYFSDGISEELLNLLAKVPGLQVTSRSSAFSFKDKEFDIPAVARKLNVAHVLEGSVRKADDRVRITAQLIETRTDAHLWSSTYDRELDDIFAIQDEIAGTVVEQLKVTLLGDAPRSAQVDPEAYTLYLQARHLGRQYNAESLERSNELYQQSLAIEADIAGAWSGLATNYTNAVFTGLLSSGEGYPLARAAAEKALAIDPAYAPAHANLGWITYGYDNDVAQAVKHYQRALELDPSNSYIIRSAAVLLSSLNRLDEAIVLGEYVTRLDPLVASGHHNLGTSYCRAHRWDEAVASHQAGLRLSPDFLGGHYFMGVALLFGGEPAAALDAFAVEQDDEYRVKGTALALHALGRQEESQARLAELKERWGEDWPTEVAHVYAYIGDADAAFEWLDRAIEKNEEGLSEQFLQPFYQNLYTDARWQSFLENVGSSPERLSGIEFNVVLPE
jgi:TolB-like protein/lipoprotein NlpI